MDGGNQRTRTRLASSECSAAFVSGNFSLIPVAARRDRKKSGPVARAALKVTGYYSLQKISFIANCNCRPEPGSPVENRVPVILPKLVLPTAAVRPGFPKFA